MPKETGEFFVVGGPVQPDRACYVPRAADDELLQAIGAQRFAYVLSPRATGKSSLMGRTIRRLRNDGQLAAVVDLTQIGARSESGDAGRWYYTIAYRIVRELRLKVDLQAWWHDKGVLASEQRLAEFFWEVILTNTAAAVTVFIDEAERAIDLPFSNELFAVIQSCYARRVSEPDYSRLNFVVLGVATPEQLCSDDRVSPFVDGRAVELGDFKLQECYRLAPGLSADEDVGRGLIDRIYPWTSGQPYLTQKLARGVARKGSKLADVDRVVHELFLAPGVSQEEPLLNHIRSLLNAPTPSTRQALILLRRIAKGAEVFRDSGSTSRTLLQLDGIVSADREHRLRYRNRIYSEVFDARWAASSAPSNWRLPLGIAAAAALAALISFWYLRVLPGPYVNTLSVVSQDYAIADEAYRRLRRLPGFAGTADRLLADAMVRRSQRTMTMSEVLAADAVLRTLPDGPELADEMLAHYWLRQSQAAAHRGDRDAALIYAMEARAGQEEPVRALAAELIGTDYERLEQSFRLTQPPLAWEVDWGEKILTVIDQSHEVRHFSLQPEGSADSGDDTQPVTRIPGRLTAVQHVPVVRTIEVDGAGTAGAFNLLLTAQHARASDLLLVLRAPSGARAELAVPQPRADQQEFIFSARSGSALAALATEPIEGQWELTIVDRRAGESGALNHWSLQFAGGGRVWEDEPEQGIAMPDPVRTEQIDVRLSRDGRMAIAVPTRLGAAGAVSVWDLRAGGLVSDLPVSSTPVHVELVSEPRRVLIVTESEVALWDIDEPRVLARFALDSASALPPAVSADELFVVIAEGDPAAPVFSLLETDTGQRLARFPGWPGTTGWALARGASYLAVLDGSRRGRLLDPRSGDLLTEFIHQRELVRVVPMAREHQLVTVDVDGAVLAWRAVPPEFDVSTTESLYLGATADPSSLTIAVAAPMLAFDTAEHLVALRSISGRERATFLGASGAGGAARLRLESQAHSLVTAVGPLIRLWRTEPETGGGPSVTDLSAIGVDPSGEFVALGFHGGHARVKQVTELGADQKVSQSVDYIGHRGMITSLAVSAAHNVFASGGEDGVVRLWSVQSVAPNEFFLRHTTGPVHALSFSNDAQLLISAADYSARVWQTQTGELVGEIPVNGTALAVAFSPRSDLVAVGDSAGTIFFGASRGAEILRSSRARSAVTALAFSPDSQTMASGDAGGNLLLWDVLNGEPSKGVYLFPQPVDWIRFRGDGRQLLARTGQWVHELDADAAGLSVVESRLLPTEFDTDAVLTELADGTIRVVGSPSSGLLVVRDFVMSAPIGEPLAADSPLLARDWSRALGLSVDRAAGIVRIARR